MTALPDQSNPAPSRGEAATRDLFAYIAPMVGFLVLTSLESWLPTAWYPAAYTLKVVIVTAIAWIFRWTWRDLKPFPGASSATLAILVGLIVYVLWVRLEGQYPALGFLGKRTAFDPGTLPAAWAGPFVAVRLFGLVLLVPLIEELFWRSFLIRWLIDPDFLKVPVGQVTPVAAVVTSGAFALAHPEWLPALLTGLLWAGLLWKTRSLAACVLSHVVANLALGVHVLTTGDWKYW